MNASVRYEARDSIHAESLFRGQADAILFKDDNWARRNLVGDLPRQSGDLYL